jgi:hypothetical protein
MRHTTRYKNQVRSDCVRVTRFSTIKVPYYARPVHSLQNCRLSPDLELGISPVFLHFHLWIGSGSTYLRPTELGGSQVDPGLTTPGLVKLGNPMVKCNIPGVFVSFLEVEVHLGLR